MDIDRWEQVKENIKRQYKATEETGDLEVETSEGLVKQGTYEALIFDSPVGKVKVSFEKKPLMLDKKFIYSHRAGQAARTEYQFSDTEMTYKLRAYKYDDDNDEWKEIDAGSFS